MKQLPIDLMPSANGVLRFQWRQRVTSPVGEDWVEYDGPLPTTIEQAVATLIGITKGQAATIDRLTSENEELRRQVKGGRSDGKTTSPLRVTV
jgi:hypothetical protein